MYCEAGGETRPGFLGGHSDSGTAMMLPVSCVIGQWSWGLPAIVFQTLCSDAVVVVI